jgi:hypothetical protein
VESVEHGEVTLAGNTEQVVHSVELELIHQNPAAVAQRHG